MKTTKLIISLLLILLCSCKPSSSKNEDPLPENIPAAEKPFLPTPSSLPSKTKSRPLDDSEQKKRDLPPGYHPLEFPNGKAPRDWMDFTRDLNGNVSAVGLEYFYDEYNRLYSEWTAYRFGPEGEYLWKHHLRNPELANFEYEYWTHDITNDSKGNILITGFISYQPSGNYPSPPPSAYVYKINPMGEREWIYHLEREQDPSDNTAGSSCETITVDKDDNIYCAGSTQSSFFDKKTGVDILILKLSPDGNLIWGKQIGENAKKHGPHKGGWEKCMSLSVQDSGDIFCGGYTQRDLADTNSGRSDAFVLKTDSTGEVQWITQLGANTIPAPWNGRDQELCWSVAVGPKGNIYCSGYTSSELADQLNGRQDAFIAKFKPNGELVWIKQLGKTYDEALRCGSYQSSDVCYSIKVNRTGTIHCALKAGELSFILNLNPDSSTQIMQQVLVPEDPLYNPREAKYDICNRIFLDDQGAALCTGFLKRRHPGKGIHITEAFIFQL